MHRYKCMNVYYFRDILIVKWFSSSSAAIFTLKVDNNESSIPSVLCHHDAFMPVLFQFIFWCYPSSCNAVFLFHASPSLFFFQNILKQRAFLFLCLLQCYTQASDALLDLSFMACSKKAMASLGGLKKKFVKRLMPYWGCHNFLNP